MDGKIVVPNHQPVMDGKMYTEIEPFPFTLGITTEQLVVDLPPWKMMEFVNGKDDNPYMKWKMNNIWNHQPAFGLLMVALTSTLPPSIFGSNLQTEWLSHEVGCNPVKVLNLGTCTCPCQSEVSDANCILDELGKIITKSLTVEGEAYRSPIHDSRSKLGHFCSSWLSRSVQGENVIGELTLVLQELETEVWHQVPATLDFLGEPWVFHVYVRLPYGFPRPLRPFGFTAPPVVALQTLLATRAGHRSGRRRTWRLWRARGGEDIASKDATKIAII